MALREAVLALLLATGPAMEEPPRLKKARQNVTPAVTTLFQQANVAYPPAELFLRAIKDEDVLELWAARERGGEMVRVTTYRICARSGDPGPKRQRGDGQVPEGFYAINVLNPWSAFHLSLGLDYPNASDRIRKSGDDPGGDIFIHGGCATIGCLPIQDGPIEELFVIIADARAAGRALPIHLFPSRLTAEAMAGLEKDHRQLAFWEELAPGYQAFEKTRRPPMVTIDRHTGAYRVKPVRARSASGSRPARHASPAAPSP